MRIAYADPPYIGQAKKHYGKNGDGYEGEVAEVDHPALIAQLVDEYPDGWALSCKSSSLRELLPLCPSDARFVGAKPPLFCQWLFSCLGLEAHDELVDLFPGSGAVTDAWEAWRSQTRLAV